MSMAGLVNLKNGMVGLVSLVWYGRQVGVVLLVGLVEMLGLTDYGVRLL